MEVPRRAQLIRVLYCEIGRLLSHLLNVTTQAMDVGALTPPVWGFEEREKLMVFYERASGARMHANYFRPGGVARDLPVKLIEDIGAWCDPFLKVCDDLEELFIENRIFKQRNVDIAVVTARRMLEMGLFGSGFTRFRRRMGSAHAPSPTNAMRRWNSTFRSASMAIAMTGRWCAWKKCASRSAS